MKDSGYTDDAFTLTPVKYVDKYGCFCGGHGTFTDYNCGAEFERTCPHCSGTGKKACKCIKPSLRCPLRLTEGEYW